jgi:radical SAM superfamily enzyme YgiQ (UPF0313 family)
VSVRVLLVQAFTAVDMELVYPIGPAYLAAHLPGHEVRIFDLNLHRDRPYAALEQAVREFGPDVVGLSLRNMKVGMPHLHTDDFEPQRLAVETAARVAPGVPIIAGGTAFSLYARPIMERLPGLRCGVFGEAEHRLPLLLERLDRPWEVPGVWHRRGGEIGFSGMPPVVDFASLAPPRRDLVPLEPYLASSFVSVGVQAKRGCELNCIHCSDTYLAGHRVRMRDPGRVVDEVEYLVRERGVRELFFCDQLFNLPPEHAIAICRQIVARGIVVRWSAWYHEHRAALSDELLSWVKRAGCGLLSFSPDHVDDGMLARLGKNFREEDLHRTYRAAKRHGLDVEYSFFLNGPGETPASMLAIFTFLARARWHLGPGLRAFTLLMLQPIRIYPHTRLREMAVAEGLIAPDDDLIAARTWNPGPMRHAVRGIQAGLKLAYQGREAMRRRRGGAFGRLG